MYKGIEHVAIVAKDTTREAEWFRDVLGFRIVYDNKKTPPTYFVAGASGSMVEIMPAKSDPDGRIADAPGYGHLAITVDDFEAALEDLRKKGVEFASQPREASGGVKVVFFADPEGNALQLLYRPTPLV